VAKVGRSVTYTCRSDKLPAWRFIQVKPGHRSKEWLSLPNNTVTGKSERLNEYYLKIVKARKRNQGWYGCSGQYSDVHFISVGSLKVVGRLSHFKIKMHIY